MDELRPMTNKEAADFLENRFLNMHIGRGNGKTLTICRYTEAMMKAISALRNAPDED